jgi:hypothetical protein
VISPRLQIRERVGSVRARSIGSRWAALERDARVGFAGLAALLIGGIAVRFWLIAAYPPAFLGFPDSSQYAWAAADNIFRDHERPAGYPFFLRLVHHLDGQLSFAIVVQHALGLATGVLLYKAVRRTGAPAWLGLAPAAVVFFEGTGLLLEHALLADPLLAFLQAVGVYALVRALGAASLRWPALAGVAIGLAFWMKTVALSNAALAILVLLCAGVGGWRRRLRAAATVAVLVAAFVAFYVGAQFYFTGFLGYERDSAYDLYGRVATFVDCSAFTPPAGTAFLCPLEPLAHRNGQAFFQDSAESPAVQAFGPPPLAGTSANAVLERFSVAAIEHEPLAYAAAILRSLGHYLFPRVGEGDTPTSLRAGVTSIANEYFLQRDFARLYPESLGYVGPPGAQPLANYDRFTIMQGPLVVALLVAGLLGPFLLRGRMRWGAALFTLTALVTITFACAGNGYDARYAYPTFGPLAAGGALGAWAAAQRLAGLLHNRRARSADVAATPP